VDAVAHAQAFGQQIDHSPVLSTDGTGPNLPQVSESNSLSFFTSSRTSIFAGDGSGDQAVRVLEQVDGQGERISNSWEFKVTTRHPQ